MRRWLPLSLTTALSPSLPVLLFGWSLVEGLGAVLVIPAIAALVAANYEGRQRALAYSVIGATAGIAIALGPLIGGWVTTTFTWRYVFVGEVVMVIVILLARKQMTSETRIENPPKLDLVGAALSALGLGLIVLGVLKSSTWGWLLPKGALTIAGHEIAPLGFSVVPFMILGGLALLWAFFSWEDRRERLGLDILLHRSLLGIKHLRAGLSSLLGQQFVVMGIFFVLPVYLRSCAASTRSRPARSSFRSRSRCCSRRSRGRTSQPDFPPGPSCRRASLRWRSPRSCSPAPSTSS